MSSLHSSSPRLEAAKVFGGRAAWDDHSPPFSSTSPPPLPFPILPLPPTPNASPPLPSHSSPPTPTPSAPPAWPQNVAALEPNELLRLLVSHGGEVPSDRLAAVSARIEATGAMKAPSTLSQRRVFVRDWMERQLKDQRRAGGGGVGGGGGGGGGGAAAPGGGGGGGGGGGAGRGAADGPTSGAEAPPTPPLGGKISGEEAELLATVSQLFDPAGRLHIPAELMPKLTSDVTLALGKHKSPPSLSARRRLIEDWYTATLKRVASADAPTPSAQLASPSLASPPPPLQGLRALHDSLPTLPNLPHTPSSPPLDESSEFRISQRGQYSPAGSPLGSPASHATSDGAAATLFASLAAAETKTLQVAFPVLPPAELHAAAATICNLTGASLPSAAELHSFVGDWWRWQTHLQHRQPSPPQWAEASCISPPPRQTIVPPHGALQRPHTAPAAPLRTQGEDNDEAEMTEQDILLELLSATQASNGRGRPADGELDMSSRRLAVVARQIELLSGKRAPKLQTQKRDYVLHWLRAALDRQAHTDRIHSGAPPPRTTPARRVEYNPISAYEPLRSYERNQSIVEALSSLLGEFGEPAVESGGGAALNVPLDRLAIVVEQVEQLTGEKAPRQPRARREFLAEVYTKMRPRR